MNAIHRWLCRSAAWRQTVQNEILPWVLDGMTLGEDLLEVGPGPGMTTDELRHRVPRLTALEVDTRLASSLRSRMEGSNVTVVEGDGARMPFDDGAFSSAVSFTMLHHVPSVSLQDRLLAEVHRVLRPGGLFAGSDSTPNLAFRLIHINDTMVLVDPATFGARLEAAGFRDVTVERGRSRFRFRGTKA